MVILPWRRKKRVVAVEEEQPPKVGAVDPYQEVLDRIEERRLKHERTRNKLAATVSPDLVAKRVLPVKIHNPTTWQAIWGDLRRASTEKLKKGPPDALVRSLDRRILRPGSYQVVAHNFKGGVTTERYLGLRNEDLLQPVPFGLIIALVLQHPKFCATGNVRSLDLKWYEAREIIEGEMVATDWFGYFFHNGHTQASGKMGEWVFAYEMCSGPNQTWDDRDWFISLSI